MKTRTRSFRPFATRQLSKPVQGLKETTTMLHKAKTIAVITLLTLGMGVLPATAKAQFDPNVYYSLVCKTSGMALDDAGSSLPDTKEIQWTWGASNPNQAWKITSTPEDSLYGPYYYNLTCKSSGMALDNGNTSIIGNYVIQWPLQNGDPNQDWMIQPAAKAPGYYNLTCKSSGMALDNGNTNKTGNPVIQWPLENGNTNQQWAAVPLYSWVAITFQTGGDDLRGSVSWPFGSANSWVDVTLTINGNQQTFYDISQNQNWGSNSVHTVYLRLNTPVAFISSGDIKVTLSQWWNGTYSSDNWDMEGLWATLYSTDPDPNALNNYATMKNWGYLEADKPVFAGSGSTTWRQVGAQTSTSDFPLFTGR